MALNTIWNICVSGLDVVLTVLILLFETITGDQITGFSRATEIVWSLWVTSHF